MYILILFNYCYLNSSNIPSRILLLQPYLASGLFAPRARFELTVTRDQSATIVMCIYTIFDISS